MAGGCSTSAPTRFYTLDSTAAPDGAPAARIAVLVGPLSFPEAVDRPQIVVQVASNQVEVDEFNRWAAPLNDGIARAVAEDLAVLLGTPDMAVAPTANFKPSYWVTINVQRFDSIRGQAVIIAAVGWCAGRRTAKSAPAARALARAWIAMASTRWPPRIAARWRR